MYRDREVVKEVPVPQYIEVPVPQEKVVTREVPVEVEKVVYRDLPGETHIVYQDRPVPVVRSRPAARVRACALDALHPAGCVQ